MFKILTRAYSIALSRNSRLLCRSADRNLQFFEQNQTTLISRDLQHSSRMATNITQQEPKHTNRLAQEKSPYLLQHAHNPVDWYPWGDEAIQRAKDENKLIFLSVGYSTCHWCHVMEHESFENEEVAKIMNENFINVKVDREERPDIDKIYMNFLLILNGSGGWPMSVWLTPDLAPVTAGTYFPPTDRWGMPGFKTVLNVVAQKWKDNQQEMSTTGHKIIQAIRKSLSDKSSSEESTGEAMSVEAKFDQCVKIFKRNADLDYGGFGTAPKFPEVSKLNFLTHAYLIKKDTEVLDLVLKTLKKIGRGGIHDHVFGGFARYSVDRQWHVPHFEKMLYDQGQLLAVYANSYKITKDKFYINIADGIFRYIMKDLRHPGGGFYSGEDADSLPTEVDDVKVEGAFYAWTYSEIRDAIEENASKYEMEASKVFEIYSSHYDIQETGNVEPSSDPHGHLNAKNILIVRKSFKTTCDRFGLSPEELEKLLKTTNGILHEIRDQRPRPHLDTKIITAWNGLVLSGLSILANCCTEKREEYKNAATDLVRFIHQYLYDKEKKVLMRSCYAQSRESAVAEVLSDPIDGFLDDYAFLIRGLLDYYKCTLDITALEWAKDLQDTQDSLFWDEVHGGYFYSQENSRNVIVRLKEDHDGAEPCGNSIAAKNLLLISVYYEDTKYKERAKKLFDFFSDTKLFGYVLPEMMSAQLLIDRGLEMMAVVGPENDATQEFMNIGRQCYTPGMVIVHFNTDHAEYIKRKTSERFKMIKDQPTVYICHNKVCQMPVTCPKVLDENLRANYVVNKIVE